MMLPVDSKVSVTERLMQHEGKTGVVISQIPGGYHGVHLDEGRTVIAHYSQLAPLSGCVPEGG